MHDVQGAEFERGVRVTPKSCEERISTHGADSIDVEAGVRFCVLTNAGRAAILDVRSVNLAADEFTAQVTVWEK
ncbi:hypothetical protein BKD26_03005 [Streptomyces sp. CB03238]|nr:hypothetical protein BKD26_03005 [Streptomyces sp. CB03238]